MTATIQPLTRVFTFAATELPDIDPSMTPKEVLSHYVGAYPFLAMAEIAEPEVVGDRMVYAIKKRQAQTKGAKPRTLRLSAANAAALDALFSAADTESESANQNVARWRGLALLTQDMTSRAPTPVADAMMVPML